MTRTKEELIEDLLKEAAENGTITCPVCYTHLESDCKKCICGWKNILVEGGYI